MNERTERARCRVGGLAGRDRNGDPEVRARGGRLGGGADVGGGNERGVGRRSCWNRRRAHRRIGTRICVVS